MAAATGVSMGTGRQFVGRLGPRWHGPRFQVGRPDHPVNRVDHVVQIAREFEASHGPAGPGSGDEVAIGKSRERYDRTGPERTPMQALGPTRFEHRDFPDRQHPFRGGSGAIPDPDDPTDLLIVDRFGPIARRAARIEHGPAQRVGTTGHLDPDGRSRGPGARTLTFGPLEQADDMPR